MIRKLFFGVSLMLFVASCGNEEAEKRAEKIKEEGLAISQVVSSISAIGKIEPEQGLVSVSSENGGIVINILKETGDTLSKGDVILILKADVERVNEEVIQNQIRVQQIRAEADFSTIAQYEAQLDEKRKDLTISERLVKTGAETLQNIDTKRKDLEVILANLNTAKKNAAASQADVAVLRAQFKEAKTSTSEKTVRAEQNGVLVTMDAKLGSAISPLSSFAIFAPAGKVVVHGEIDEMFASKVSLGKLVTIMFPGTSEILAQGKITFLSPILEDKSIFYELAGEQTDRRVRRFKAELEDFKGLMINQKVQCAIQID